VEYARGIIGKEQKCSARCVTECIADYAVPYCTHTQYYAVTSFFLLHLSPVLQLLERVDQPRSGVVVGVAPQKGNWDKALALRFGALVSRRGKIVEIAPV